MNNGKGRGVDYERILADAEATESMRIYPGLEARFHRAASGGLNPEFVQRGRAATVMAMEAMREVDKYLSPEERARRRQIGTLGDPKMAVLAQSPERFFRPSDPSLQMQAMMEIVNGIGGIPDGLSLFEKAGLWTATQPLMAVHPKLVDFAMSQARRHVLKQVGGFVKIYEDGSPENVIGGLNYEQDMTGVGYEANFVVESARTEAEAEHYINWKLGALKNGARKLALKPTAMVSFSDGALARPSTKVKLKDAFCRILAEADKNRLQEENGQTCVITVDSESSPIVDMVTAAWIEACMEFPHVRVKNAMQAYFPDTEKRLLDPLMEASKKRKAAGGQPMGARLVNGANQVGEGLMASMMGWEGAPLVGSRAEAHANYMRLRKKMIDPLKDGDFTLTVGTMNMITLMDSLMELAKAGVFAAKNGGQIDFGMLEGMTGQEVFRHLGKKYGIKGHKYTPVISLDKVVELFKYYLRRIEELATKLNTIDEGAIANYLGITARFGIDSPEWATTQVSNGVLAALMHHQKTGHEALNPKVRSYRGENEPFVIPDSLENFRPVPSMAPGAFEDSLYIDARIANCENRTHSGDIIRLDKSVSPGELRTRKLMCLRGPTRPDFDLAWVELASEADVDRAFEVAEKDPSGWMDVPMEGENGKLKIMERVVAAMRSNRPRLTESLMLNAGKAILEADEEVSEAMDFVNLSRLHAQNLQKLDSVERVQPGNGVYVVVCPKNFPVAIPAESIADALLAGQRVIVKPSGGEGEETTLATYAMCQCFWEAGVPKEALMFVPCDNQVAAHMTAKAERAGFTGSTKTAKAIMKENPKLDFMAETGGRNLIFVDSTADYKQVATQFLTSVCGNAGQKCSKPIVLVLGGDVDAEALKQHVMGQYFEMLHGTALTRHVDVTPLSRQYNPEIPKEREFIDKVMNCLPGEEWLTGQINGRDVSCEPAKMGNLGIRFVKDGANFDFSKIQEIFAPVATIVQIPGGIEEFVEIQNDMGGSLTGSVFSQNREVIQYAAKYLKTGNLYFNRGNTGAKGHQYFGDGHGDAHEGAHGAKTGSVEHAIMCSEFKRTPGKFAKYDKNAIPGYDKEHRVDHTGLMEVLENMERLLKSDMQVMRGQPSYDEFEAAMHAGWSYLYENARYFLQNRPAPYQTKGQYDWVESQNVGKVLLRVSPGDSMESVLSKIFVAVAAGNSLSISIHPGMGDQSAVWETLLVGGDKGLEDAITNIQIYCESDKEFMEFLQADAASPSEQQIKFIMYSDRGKVPEAVFKKAAERSLYIDGRPVTGNGLIDSVTQFRQQAFCWVHHVAGDVGYERAIQQGNAQVELDSEAAANRPWVPYEQADLLKDEE